MVDVTIKSEYITLGQFLKYVGIIGNGSEAKLYLANNNAYVNDVLDTRRGKKIYPGDVVKVNNQVFKVIS